MSTFKTNIDVQKKIRVNGVQYSSVDEMPPDIRALYEKAIAGGTAQRHTTTKITINGQEYNSIDDVPAPMRPLVSGALKAATMTPRSRVWTAVLLALVILGAAVLMMRLR